MAEALSVISGDDIALWRSKKQKSKEIYSKSDAGILEKIDAKLTIKTNIVDQIEVPVRGFVTEPKILHAKSIDFGEVQLGSKRSEKVEIFNPFNETLYFQLFIGPSVEALEDKEKSK